MVRKIGTVHSINNFIVNKVLNKRIEWVYYPIYIAIALFVVKEDIGRVSPMSYWSLIIIGLLGLFVGIPGIRDKKWYAISTQSPKKEAMYMGYFSLTISIVVLIVLHFRASIFGG